MFKRVRDENDVYFPNLQHNKFLEVLFPEMLEGLRWRPAPSLYLRMSDALVNSQLPNLHRDLQKAKSASKFIGRGSALSATEQYRVAAGNRANVGYHEAKDVVFVSADGKASGRVRPDFAEIEKAVQAGATLVTDGLYSREHTYNVGEQEVAAFLASVGYAEEPDSGRWVKKTTPSEYASFGFFGGLAAGNEEAKGRVVARALAQQLRVAEPVLAAKNGECTVRNIDREGTLAVQCVVPRKFLKLR